MLRTASGIPQDREKHKSAILFGYTEKAGGHLYNCALLVDRNGEIAGHYHKTHLQDHDLRFSPGESLPVFETEWGKTGVLIGAACRAEGRTDHADTILRHVAHGERMVDAHALV